MEHEHEGRRQSSSRGPAARSADGAGTRRGFLAASALFAGAAAALAGCRTSGAAPLALARPGRRVPLRDGQTIKVGVIGVGGMGGEHCDQLARTRKRGEADVEVVAISDVCKPRLDGWTKRAGELQGTAVDGYVDYHELLARDDLHGVLIASPEHQHAPMSLAAIAAGKDVYCEKPMTLTLAEALAVEGSLAGSDLVYQVGSQFVMQPKYRHARELIAAGAIGHPTLSQASYCRNSEEGEWLYDVDPLVVPGETLDWERWLGPLERRAWDPELFFRWRRYRELSGGIVADLLVHPMTPIVQAVDAGFPVRVSASGGHYVHEDMQNHDQVFLTVEFEREHTLVVAGSTCNELGIETIVRGHRANLFLGGNDCVLRPERVYAEEVDERTIRCASVEDQNELRLDWLACIRSRRPPAAPVELGTKVMVIVDLAVRSLWDGHAYAFDPRTRAVRRA